MVQQLVREGNILSQVRNCIPKGLIAKMIWRLAFTFLAYALKTFPFVGDTPSCLQYTLKVSAQKSAHLSIPRSNDALGDCSQRRSSPTNLHYFLHVFFFVDIRNIPIIQRAVDVFKHRFPQNLRITKEERLWLVLQPRFHKALFQIFSPFRHPIACECRR